MSLWGFEKQVIHSSLAVDLFEDLTDRLPSELAYLLVIMVDFCDYCEDGFDLRPFEIKDGKCRRCGRSPHPRPCADCSIGIAYEETLLCLACMTKNATIK
jgi:hypothetical protein